MTRQFYKDPPIKPLRDWRTYSIGIPVLSSALGACLFMFLAFSFTELGAIPDIWRTWIVVFAAFSTALGSSFGSIGSSVEVYSKVFEGRAKRIDWISLGLSVAATLGGFILGFSALLAGAEWAVFVRLWGPIALSVLVAGDAASDVIQLGGIFGSYNLRYAQWEAEMIAYNEEHGITEPDPPALDPSELVFDPTWPEADWPYVRRMTASLNGNRATFDRATLLQMLHERERRPLSDSTVTRHVSRVREGK